MRQMHFGKHLMKYGKENTNCLIIRNAYSMDIKENCRKYYTNRNRTFNNNDNMFNNFVPNALNNPNTNNNAGNNMNSRPNENNNLLNQHYYNYDPNNYSKNSHLNNNSNYYSSNKYNFQPNASYGDNVSYQYFSIFGSTAMCLIKPIFPDQIINKNKITIFGKGGFQFMFMKKQNNTNKYDKNNKMSIFVKINSLSNILFLTDIDNFKSPLTLKGSSNNYLIIDKHKEKKDNLLLKYKYQPLNNSMNNNNTTTTTTNNNNTSSITSTMDINQNNFHEINNTPNLTIEINENIDESIDESKKNNFEELHVTFPFSEFLIFQKAANLLLPHLLGWAKQF